MILEKTGAFQKLPMVMPSIDILSSAKRKAKRVPPSKGKSTTLNCKFSDFFLLFFNFIYLKQMPLSFKLGISNIAKRSRNKGAKQLDALMKVTLYVLA